MKIDGFHIDGFGVHHDLSADDLPDGLTIIAGPNEAGKTTLQHFLVGMLFGFTPSNRPDHHAPLRGGAYGGRLLITDPDGRSLTIARSARRSSLRITGPDGPVDDAELHDLLGGATRDLFQSIFAVHIDELAELRALSDDQVRDRVFSAGIIGAGRTAQAALTQLADERDALLKPGGRSPDKYRIKRLRSELIDARSELGAVRRASKGLPAITNRLATLELDRQKLRASRRDHQAERTLLAAVADLWPAWTDAAEARAALDHLGPVPTVSATAGERLARGAERVEDLEGVRQAAELGLAEAEAALAAVPAPGPAAAHRDAIAALVADAPVERARLTAIDDLQARVTQTEADLRDALAHLGPDCDEAWLAARDERPDTGAAMRGAASLVTTAEQQLTHLSELHRRTTIELDDAAAELEAEQALLLQQPRHPVDRVTRAAEDAALLVTLAGQREVAARRLAAAMQPPPTDTAPPADEPARTPTALLVVALVLVAAAAIALATGATIAGVVAGAGGAILGAAALATRRPTRVAAPAPSAGEASPDVLARELAEIDHELEPVLLALGLATCPSLAEATNLRARADSLAAGSAQLERDLAQLALRQDALAAKRTRHQHRAEAELAEAEATLASARGAWAAWLDAQDLPPHLDPIAAAEILDATTRARAHQRTLDTARADIRRSQAQHLRFTEELDALLAGTSLTVTADPLADPLAAVAELDAQLQRDLLSQRRLEAATVAVDTARRVHDQAAERARQAALELQIVLTELGATDVEEGRALVARAERAEELRRTIAQAERDLTSSVGTVPERLDQARTLLAQADPTRWADEMRRLDHTLSDADDRIDDLTTELAHLTRERDDLERSADVPTWELRVSDLEAQLIEAITRWASLTVAHQLVEGTLARYQRERQPEVVQRAAARFSQITGGRYQRLEVRGQDIIAIDAAAREVPAGALSQGTVEQLYLCMRFALAESYAKTAQLPLMLDDVTVNADDLLGDDGGRHRRMAEAIASIATEHQVFVFTGHRSTVELLQAASPSARLITLQPSADARRIGLAAG